jgi:hypothetical protein
MLHGNAHELPAAMGQTVGQDDPQRLEHVARQGVAHLDRRPQLGGALLEQIEQVLARVLVPGEEQGDDVADGLGDNVRGEDARAAFPRIGAALGRLGRGSGGHSWLGHGSGRRGCGCGWLGHGHGGHSRFGSGSRCCLNGRCGTGRRGRESSQFDHRVPQRQHRHGRVVVLEDLPLGRQVDQLGQRRGQDAGRLRYDLPLRGRRQGNAQALLQPLQAMEGQPGAVLEQPVSNWPIAFDAQIWRSTSVTCSATWGRNSQRA